MVWMDYIIIAVVGFSCLISLIRGFIREVLSLINWGCAFFITNNYYVYLSTWFLNFEDELVRNIIAIIIISTTVLIIGAVNNFIISQVIKKNGLSWIDRMLGISFGLLRGVLIVAIVLFFLDLITNLPKSEDWQKSQFIPKFNFIIRWLFEYFRSSSSFLIYVITDL